MSSRQVRGARGSTRVTAKDFLSQRLLSVALHMHMRGLPPAAAALRKSAAVAGSHRAGEPLDALQPSAAASGSGAVRSGIQPLLCGVVFSRCCAEWYSAAAVRSGIQPLL
jgi:hypothetical protein